MFQNIVSVVGELTKSRLLNREYSIKLGEKNINSISDNTDSTVDNSVVANGENSDSIEKINNDNNSDNDAGNGCDDDSTKPERKRKKGHTVYRLKKHSWINDCQNETFDVKAERRERRKARDDSFLHAITFCRKGNVQLK